MMFMQMGAGNDSDSDQDASSDGAEDDASVCLRPHHLFSYHHGPTAVCSQYFAAALSCFTPSLFDLSQPQHDQVSDEGIRLLASLKDQLMGHDIRTPCLYHRTHAWPS